MPLKATHRAAGIVSSVKCQARIRPQRLATEP